MAGLRPNHELWGKENAFCLFPNDVRTRSYSRRERQVAVNSPGLIADSEMYRGRKEDRIKEKNWNLHTRLEWARNERGLTLTNLTFLYFPLRAESGGEGQIANQVNYGSCHFNTAILNAWFPFRNGSNFDLSSPEERYGPTAFLTRNWSKLTQFNSSNQS